MSRFRSKSFRISAGIYLLLVALTIGGMIVLRRNVMEHLVTPETQKDIEVWHEFTRSQSATNEEGEGYHGPVLRTESSLSEPQVLVLLRDHFPVALSILLLVGSAVYVTFVTLLIGVLKADREDSNR